jgi:hypothetical protein
MSDNNNPGHRRDNGGVFDRAERSLGVFEDQRSAADAISGEVAP